MLVLEDLEKGLVPNKMKNEPQLIYQPSYVDIAVNLNMFTVLESVTI